MKYHDAIKEASVEVIQMSKCYRYVDGRNIPDYRRLEDYLKKHIGKTYGVVLSNTLWDFDIFQNYLKAYIQELET